ncbi:lipocalin family protein [Hymenobacter sp.]|uniref:lipocalin family protein n=1 Tax=Hymenobacter sp. TaxID=1898978 RepID=UPI00286B7F3B|nr:lipocalin family protein [Hymenobacter sp.]
MLHVLTRLLPLSLLLLSATCQPRDPAATPPASTMQQLEGTWLNSREEDRGDTLVFRPNTYAFPPARGRTGFAIKPSGRFEQFDIAPTDGLATRPGTWTADGNTRLRIHLTDGQEPDYTLEILSLDKQVLKMRRL